MIRLLRVSTWVICAVFALIGLAKPYFPTHVGLFVYPDRHWAFGIMKDTQGSVELLGVFVMPITLGLTALLLLALYKDPAPHP